MIEVDIVTVIINVLLVFPLLMASLLYADYEIDGHYYIKYEITEFEDLKINKGIIIRLIRKVKQVVCINE